MTEYGATMKKVGGGAMKLLLNLFFIMLSVFSLYPIIWMVYSSLKTDQEFFTSIIQLPSVPQFDNYSRAIKIGKIDIFFKNSVYVSVVSVLFIVLFSFILGYFFNRFRFRGRTFLRAMFTAGMMIPVHGFLVPLYIQFSRLGLTNRWFTLFLPIVAFNLPLTTILMTNFMDGIPMEVEESAVIDGATLGQRIFQVVFPMALPIVATVTILSFLWAWNEYPFSLALINSNYLKTLPLGISGFRGERSTNYPMMFAALTLVSLPVLLVYSCFSNKIMQGMTAGAVKG